MKVYYEMKWTKTDKDVCCNCRYFFQHYVSVDGGKFCVPCYCGHCTIANGKTRKPNQSCDGFQRRELD